MPLEGRDERALELDVHARNVVKHVSISCEGVNLIPEHQLHHVWWFDDALQQHRTVSFATLPADASPGVRGQGGQGPQVEDRAVHEEAEPEDHEEVMREPESVEACSWVKRAS